MRHQNESNLSRYLPIDLPLLESRCKGQEKQDIPWNSHLKEHLHIQPLEQTGIQLRPHKKVINMRPRHPVLSSPSQSRHVRNDRNEESRTDPNRHNRPKFINERIQSEGARKVEDQRNNNRRIP